MISVPLYDRLFAALYDRTLRDTERAGLAERRERLLAEARGRVLEIGAGTGLNLAHYPDGIETLTLTEPSHAMANHLRDRLKGCHLSVLKGGNLSDVIEAGAAELPFEDGAFDTVVATLVLCTVPDPAAALREIKRVLAPGGQLLLIEHVRSDDPGRAKWQDRLETPWRIFGNGCHCNRDTEQLVEAAGFKFSRIEHGKMRKAPPIVRPLIQGSAEVTA